MMTLPPLAPIRSWGRSSALLFCGPRRKISTTPRGGGLLGIVGREYDHSRRRSLRHGGRGGNAQRTEFALLCHLPRCHHRARHRSVSLPPNRESLEVVRAKFIHLCADRIRRSSELEYRLARNAPADLANGA